MGLGRENWIFEGLWHVRAGKDHQDPKDGQNIENCSKVFARLLEVCLPDSLIHCKQRCKARSGPNLSQSLCNIGPNG